MSKKSQLFKVRYLKCYFFQVKYKKFSFFKGQIIEKKNLAYENSFFNFCFVTFYWHVTNFVFGRNESYAI